MKKNKNEKLLEEIINDRADLKKRERNAIEVYEEMSKSPFADVEEIKERLIHELNPNFDKINPYNTLLELLEDENAYGYYDVQTSELDPNFLYDKFIDKLQKWKYISIYTDENNKEYNNAMLLKKTLTWFIIPIASSTSPDNIDFIYDIAMNNEVYFGLKGYKMDLEEKEYEKEYKKYMN